MAYGYRTYDAPSPLLIGYDPFRDLPDDHLARLIEMWWSGCRCRPRRSRARASRGIIRACA